MSVHDDDPFDGLPTGWRVLWCPVCNYSVVFTDEVAQPYDEGWEVDLRNAAVHEHA